MIKTAIHCFGIDPGASGGIVLIPKYGENELQPMPETIPDIWNWFQGHSEYCFQGFACIEYINPGFKGPGKSQMSKLYGNYTALLMALAASKIPFEIVKPAAWQKEFGMHKKKKENQNKWKNRLKERAQQLFPNEHITLKTADALLLAEYCRRKHGVKTRPLSKKRKIRRRKK